LYEDPILVSGELDLRARSYRTDLDESPVARIVLSTTSLPVTWNEVTAAWTENCRSVEVRWSTSSEESVSDFRVERYSEDGWAAIPGSLAPGANAYALIDKVPEGNTPLYRVLQTDLDGSFQYSVVVMVFPNPAKDRLMVVSDERISHDYQVVDALGRSLLVGRFTGRRTEIDLSGLSAGVYWLMSDGKPRRFVKQ